MSVKHTHPEYDAMVDKWDRCIRVAKGQDAVHASNTVDLPQLTDQDNNEYESYKSRALFYNATWRTIVGLQGMLFRKPPKIQVPVTVEALLDDITMSGVSLHMFALELAEECLKVGRAGIFVDYPTVDVSTTTAADAIAANLRPMFKMYTAKGITNWKTRTYKNSTVLSLIVLKELVAVPVDEYEDKEEERFRVLDLIDVNDLSMNSIKTIYRVREIRVEMQSGKEVDVVLKTSFPMINGEYLDYIPFQFVGVDDTSWCIDEPPLIDLVDTNLSHYRVTADYEHGCHFTGLPTPVISGYTPERPGEKFYIGSMTAWVFPNANAKATYLEFTGQGLGCLKENLERKELMMAVLGARMLEAQPTGVESADTAAIHRGGEQSMLASVAQAISIGVTEALTTFSKFAGADTSEIKFELNRDFFPIPMDALTLTAIIAGWQNGAYSYDTMFENLRKGEIVTEDQDAKEEQASIKANPPPVMDVPTTPGNRAGNGPNKGAAKGTNSKKGATSSNKTITQLQNS
jgi:hypothetical protein